MIDKREGFTKKPAPEQESYFNDKPTMPNKGNKPQSQKVGPGTVKPE